jgi:2-polyprenyl-3-methyl-5-hydroxy-6-metoxy-1,4-benzoquinol methylase
MLALERLFPTRLFVPKLNELCNARGDLFTYWSILSLLRILDFGSSTGGGTLALALSKQLAAQFVVGIDPSGPSIRAGWARLEENYTPGAKIEFQEMKTN